MNQLISRMAPPKFFTVFLIVLAPVFLKASDYFIMDKFAYKDYVSVGNYSSVKDWVAAKKYNCQGFNKFCPENTQLYWVRYFHIPTGLGVWFWVVDADEQGRATQFLENSFNNYFSSTPQLAVRRSEIVITDITFKTGQCLNEADLSVLISLQKSENEKTGSLKNQLGSIESKLGRLIGKIDNLDRQTNKEAAAQAIINEAERLAEAIDDLKNGSLSDAERKIIGDARAKSGLPAKGKGIDTESADGSSVDGKDINTNPADGSSVNGKEGNGGKKNGLPFNSRFSKWFQAIIDIIIYVVEYYFQIPLRAYLEQAFYIFNTFFPELLESLDSFFGKLQDMVFPDNFERAMDSAADIYFKADEYLQYLHRAISVIQSGNLQSIAKGQFDFSKLSNLPLNDFLDAYKKITGKSLGKYGDMAANLLGKMNFNDLKSLDAKKIKNLVKQKGKDILIKEAEKKAKQYTKIDIDISGFLKCTDNRKNCKDWGKNQGAAVIRGVLPDKYKGYEKLVINGEYKEVAKKVIYTEIQNRTNINPYELEQSLSHLRDKNYRAAVKVLAKNHLHYFGPYKDLAEQVLNDGKINEATAQKAIVGLFRQQGLEEAAQYIDKYGLEAYEYWKSGKIKEDIREVLDKKIDPSVINDFVNRNAEAGMDKLIDKLAEDGLGFTSPEAREAFRNGNFDKAFELQMEAGGWQKIDYQEKAETYVKYVKNRLQMVKGLVDRRQSKAFLRRCLEMYFLEYRMSSR